MSAGNQHLRSRTSTYAYIFLFAFLGLLLLPFLSVSAQLTGLVDNSGELSSFINGYTETRLTLGDVVFNRTVVGNDGWLYLTTQALTGYQHTPRLTPDRLEEIQRTLEHLQRQVEADGTVFLFVIVPEKSTIYPQNVPGGIPRSAESSPFDQLTTRLDQTNSPLHLLDLRPTLEEAARTYPLYYATDSHWNQFGAFFAYQKIMETLQRSMPGLSHHSLADFDVVAHDPGLFDLASIIGSTSLTESSFDLVPINRPAPYIASSLTTQRTGPLILDFSQSNDSSAPTALFFDDSYFNALKPFLAEHFSSAYYVQYYTENNMTPLQWDEQFQTDIVVVELVERNIAVIPDLFR